MFASFWAAAGGSGGDLHEDIAAWPAQSNLGSHTHGSDQLVLLVRGALFRRFPTALIYLSQTAADGTETHQPPIIGGSVGADTVFFGFPLSPQEAKRATPPWSIVIAESVHHARFGVDDAPAVEKAVITWQDIDWSSGQFAVPGGGIATYVPIHGPLLGAAHPISPDEPSPSATWGLSSAHQAVILQQPAFRIRIPVALWLNPLTGG
jgi:hypothetical protein